MTEAVTASTSPRIVTLRKAISLLSRAPETERIAAGMKFDPYTDTTAMRIGLPGRTPPAHNLPGLT